MFPEWENISETRVWDVRELHRILERWLIPSFIKRKIRNLEITSLARVWYATGSYVIRIHYPGSIIRLWGMRTDVASDARVQPRFRVHATRSSGTACKTSLSHAYLLSLARLSDERMQMRRATTGGRTQLWKLAAISEKILSRIILHAPAFHNYVNYVVPINRYNPHNPQEHSTKLFILRTTTTFAKPTHKR